MGVTNFGGLGIRDINKPTATITVDSTMSMILADATAGAVTVNLPAVASSKGRLITVKKVDSGGNAVTLDGAGAETIDGATTLATTTQWVAFTVWCDGTAWFAVAKYS